MSVLFKVLIILAVVWLVAAACLIAVTAQGQAPATPVIRMTATQSGVTIYAPSNQVTMRKSLDKSETIIEVDFPTPPVPSK